MELDKIRKQSIVLNELVARLENKLDKEIRISIEHDLTKLVQGSQNLKKFLCDQPEKLDQNQIVTVRHDLRNLLGGINGYAEMIEEECVINSHGHQITNNIIHAVQQTIQFVLPPSEQQSSGELAAMEMIELSNERRTDPGHILVIDDNENNRTLLARFLQKLGHSVVCIESAEEAWKTIGQQSFDLILLDLIMPNVNGFELLKQFKANDKLRRIPVIMVSGMQETEGVIKCIKAGAEDYLTKPYNPVLLEARISAGLDRKRLHDREDAMLKELEKRNQFIRQTFGRYLTNEIVDNLLEHPDGLNLGGAYKNVTIVMTDIRGFTRMCEQLNAEDVVKVLNNYLSVMTKIIMKYKGIVDEIIGDALLVLFGTPIERDNDADRAVACSIEMQSAMEEVNAKNAKDGLPEISMGIGINTGKVVAGNIGSDLRSKYAVVGHNVNIAARIESKTNGGEILVSQSTIDAVTAPLEVGEPKSIKMKGVSDRLNVYTISGIGGEFDLKL